MRRSRGSLPPAQRVRGRSAARSGGGAHLGSRSARPRRLDRLVGRDLRHRQSRRHRVRVERRAHQRGSLREHRRDAAPRRRGERRRNARVEGALAGGVLEHRCRVPHAARPEQPAPPRRDRRRDRGRAGRLAARRSPSPVHGATAVERREEPTSRSALVHASSRWLRGDEANLLDPVDGYVTVDAAASYEIGKRRRSLGSREQPVRRASTRPSACSATRRTSSATSSTIRASSRRAHPRAAWLGLEMRWR